MNDFLMIIFSAAWIAFQAFLVIVLTFSMFE